MKCSFLLGIVAWSYVTSSFGMMLDEADQKMGDDSAIRNRVNSALTSVQTSLEEVKTALVEAVRECNCRRVLECYVGFKKLDTSWEQEAKTSHVLAWESSSDLKSQVGAQLFWDAAIDEPHQNLLRQALKPLEIATVAAWQDTYDTCVKNIHDIIEAHGYLRLPARAHAISISGHYGNKVAQLFTLEFLRFLNPDDTHLFQQGHFTVSFSLSNNESTRISLQTFLAPDTAAFVDLQGIELEDEEALIRMRNLGLPRYDVLLGDYYFRKLRKVGRLADQPRGNMDELLTYCRQAAEGGDPTGYLSISGVQSSIGEMGQDKYYAMQKKAFLRGCFDVYDHLLRKDQKELKEFTRTLYNNLKKLLTQRKN